MYKQNKNGYSIVEIIVYLAIFTAVSILVINSLITVLGSFNTTRTNRDLLESGSNTMERISREIRQAKNIDQASSTFELHPGVLQLNSTDEEGDIKVVKFSTTNGVLNLYENDILTGNLLGQSVSVTNLIFRRIITTNGEAVKVELTLQSTRGGINKSTNFYNTVILRGGY